MHPFNFKLSSELVPHLAHAINQWHEIFSNFLSKRVEYGQTPDKDEIQHLSALQQLFILSQEQLSGNPIEIEYNDVVVPFRKKK